MAGGYAGKIAFIDLTTGEIKTEILDEKLARDFIGGHGIGAAREAHDPSDAAGKPQPEPVQRGRGCRVRGVAAAGIRRRRQSSPENSDLRARCMRALTASLGSAPS